MYALPSVADGPTTADVVRGITTASAIGRTVINLSLAGPGFSESEYEAVMSAVKRGALVVAAAGNDFARGNPRDYPGAYPHVLTAAATGKTDQPSIVLDREHAVDLAAPGESIAVPHPTDPTIWKTVAGTSFSSPIVAAAAAWLWTVRPDLDAGQVAEMLRESARDINSPGFDDRTGYGLVNLPAALTAPTPPKDLLEPNDDIDQVAAGRLFAAGSTPLTTQAKRSVRISASLDQNEDPEDVYRVVIPAGRTFVDDGDADHEPRRDPLEPGREDGVRDRRDGPEDRARRQRPHRSSAPSASSGRTRASARSPPTWTSGSRRAPRGARPTPRASLPSAFHDRDRLAEPEPGHLEARLARMHAHPVDREAADDRIGDAGGERLDEVVPVAVGHLAHARGDVAVVDGVLDAVGERGVGDVEGDVEEEVPVALALLCQDAVAAGHLEAAELDGEAHATTALAAASASTCSRTSWARMIVAPRS